MQKRVHVYYSGSVQGVGFRYTARSLANSLRLNGWVKNVPDGRVELVAEGEENVLKGYLSKIKEELNYCNFKESVSWAQPTGEFNRFEIAF